MLRRLNLIALGILFVFSSNYVSKADQPSAEVIKVAEAYATSFCGGRIDNGVPYYGPGKGDIVWVFTVYKKSNPFPTESDIRTMVADAREKRLQAEAEFEYYRQGGDRRGTMEAQRKIKKAFTEMRSEESFATVYVADYQNGYKINAKVLHHGLPLHYTAFLDAEQRAKNYLNKASVKFERYIYLNPLFIHGGFKGTDTTAYVNLVFLEEQVLKNMDLVEFSYNFYESIGTQTLTSGPPGYPQIQGVPDFYVGHNSCAMMSTTNILCYWERTYQEQCANYDRIIYGGDWDYEGFYYNPNPGIGEGWSGLCADEIGKRIGWTPGSMTSPSAAMQAGAQIMNESFRGRNYTFSAFQVHNQTITNKNNMYLTFDDFCNQVDTGNPFQYSYWGKLRYWMDGMEWFQDQAHSMVGVGHHDEDPSDPTNNALHWRACVWGGGDHTPDVQWFNDEQDCDLNAGGYIQILLYAMTPGGMHWSGNMTSNTIWSNNVYVDGDLNINNGVALSIAAGTSVLCEPGISINISGYLDASGGWSNRIIFDCTNPASYWGGIKFHEGCDENSMIYRCNISHAIYGIFLDRASPAIRYYNTISNCV